MPYIKIYDQAHDELFQAEITAETALRAPPHAQVSDTPFPNLPVKSRYWSERHPEPKETE
jgi:hypothetical protein